MKAPKEGGARSESTSPPKGEVLGTTPPEPESTSNTEMTMIGDEDARIYVEVP